MLTVFSFFSVYGLSFLLWGSIGLTRFFSEQYTRRAKRSSATPMNIYEKSPLPHSVRFADVAVLIAAHNEEGAINKCLEALRPVIPGSRVFVGSDGSTDKTVEIVKSYGCNVVDIQPNRGKANALQYTLDYFSISKRYKAVLILDADSEIDIHYLEHALPLFDDPRVAAVAGHAIPKWHSHWIPKWGMLFVSYRVRLYKLTQAILRYGQTWKHTNVSFIIPGFASMYRCNVLPYINITAKGLIIEDFNMTFELHHKKLGKIAYSPSVRCACHEPTNLKDYYKQVKRWYLGFWQTVKLHGIWPGAFWLALLVFLFEMVTHSFAFVMLPLALCFGLLSADMQSLLFTWLGMTEISIFDIAITLFVVDYCITLIISALERKPILLVYGLAFLFLRWIDAFLFIITLPLSFVTKSDGRWISPTRT